MPKHDKEETPLLDAQEAQMELIRRAAECKYNDGVVCGLWKKEPSRCDRCGRNPNKGKERPAP